jgi:hypothetical protein
MDMTNSMWMIFQRVPNQLQAVLKQMQGEKGSVKEPDVDDLIEVRSIARRYV